MATVIESHCGSRGGSVCLGERVRTRVKDLVTAAGNQVLKSSTTSRYRKLTCTILYVCNGDRYALLVSTTVLRSNMRVLLVSE
jgi:hypothetical protein